MLIVPIVTEVPSGFVIDCLTTASGNDARWSALLPGSLWSTCPVGQCLHATREESDRQIRSGGPAVGQCTDGVGQGQGPCNQPFGLMA